MEIWQTGFSDHRIRDAEDFRIHLDYIWRNPVGRKLVEIAAEYPYSSAFPGSLKDEFPQWLKPVDGQSNGAPKGAPLQQIPRGLRSIPDDGSCENDSAAAEQEMVTKN